MKKRVTHSSGARYPGVPRSFCAGEGAVSAFEHELQSALARTKVQGGAAAGGRDVQLEAGERGDSEDEEEGLVVAVVLLAQALGGSSGGPGS